MTNINGNDASGSLVGGGPVAGETLKDRSSWPGYGLIFLALFSLASGLTALATGHRGPAVGGFVTAVVAFAIGTFWLIRRHRRMHAKAVGTGTPERPEDAGPVV